MNEIITPFAYSDLPPPIAAELQAATARVKDRLTRQVSDIIETGRDLIEVKSKLQHGQFESWLAQEFGMTPRTARLFMRAATWAEGKSEIVSVLTPATVYALSAPSTPESAQRQVLDDLEAGKPVNHREVSDLIREVKHQEREAKEKKEQRETRAERKQRKACEEQWRRKEEEERQRIRTAAMAVAREVADILVNKLSDEEITKVEDALMDLNVDFMILRGAIFDARDSHSDNILSDRDLVPSDGCAMQAIWEGGKVYIWPSAEHPGFFFVAIVLDVDGGGAVAEGFTRPIRADGVVMFFGDRIRSLVPDGTEWETFPADPWEYNLYLGPHDPLSSSRTAR